MERTHCVICGNLTAHPLSAPGGATLCQDCQDVLPIVNAARLKLQEYGYTAEELETILMDEIEKM